MSQTKNFIKVKKAAVRIESTILTELLIELSALISNEKGGAAANA